MTEDTPFTIPARSMNGAWPHVTVGALVVDEIGNTIILHRSDKVRSAKNCWSIPTGLLDHGESIEDALVRELDEELGLHVLPRGVSQIAAVGENQPGDGFHWVLVYHQVLVRDVSLHVNNEPDKHDRVMTMSLRELHRRLRRCRDSELGKIVPDPEDLVFSLGLAAPLVHLLHVTYGWAS